MPKTILVVEDDSNLAELLATFIDGDDYQTVLAADGNEGLRLAHTVSPALVLCDKNMPGLSGTEVLRALRANPATAHLPLVLMSGEQAADFRKMGADAFLPKPFTFDTVIEMVRRFTAQQEHAGASGERIAA